MHEWKKNLKFNVNFIWHVWKLNKIFQKKPSNKRILNVDIFKSI